VSESNVEIVRRLYAANRLGPPEETIDVTLALSTPDFEFRSRVAAVEGRDYHGHEGGRRYFEDMAEAWREWHNEPEEMVEVSPDAVLVDSTFYGVGRDSGMPVQLRSSIVFVLSEGKITRALSYATREEALAAAGLADR
jgi:ketosteroid isomerase-like protein